jgi:hypothetical protein
MATLPAAGIRAARPERPSSDAIPVISQGAPVIGTSTPSTGLSSFTTALAARTRRGSPEARRQVGQLGGQVDADRRHLVVHVELVVGCCAG